MTKLEFDAVIQSGRDGGALVRLPIETAEVFGTRARFAVRATFNGVEYLGSTMPMGDGLFCLGITKAVRADAGADIGHTVHVIVERDIAGRTVQVPEDLAVALEQAGLAATFQAMAYTHRKEYTEWIASAKKPETRRRRVAEAVARIGGHQVR